MAGAPNVIGVPAMFAVFIELSVLVALDIACPVSIPGLQSATRLFAAYPVETG